MDPALWKVLEGDLREEVAVILRLREGAGPPESVRVVSRFGSIATARVRRGDVVALRLDERIASVKAARELRADMTLSQAAELPARSVYETRNPWWANRRGPLGRGVVLGIVDWGIDVTHPNLLRADGGTRLLALWDQRGGPQARSRAPYGYGRVFGRPEIDRALRSRDPFDALAYDAAEVDYDRNGTHGMHVTDLAAGRPRFGPGGVAPAAELVFVHMASIEGGPRSIGNSVSLLEAVDFIARVAGERPLVVNLSLGSHAGPHDGRTPVEQALDHFVLEVSGRSVVQTVGNYGTRPVHAKGSLRKGERHVLEWLANRSDDTPNELDLWYPGPDRVSVRLVDDDGHTIVHATPDSHGPIIVRARHVGRFAHRTHDPNNGDNQVAFIVEPFKGGERWRVVIEPLLVRSSDGQWHAWIERDETRFGRQSYLRSRTTEDSAAPQTTTGTIANGFHTITVGAYDARNGRVAAFSSRGPTRDGRKKPDIYARGVLEIGARSAPIEEDDRDPWLTKKTGTSMASPQVAGAVALLYEAAGRPLSTAEVRAALGIGGVEPVLLDIERSVARVRMLEARARPAPSTLTPLSARNGLEFPVKAEPPERALESLAVATRASWAGHPAALFDAYTVQAFARRPGRLSPYVEIIAYPGEAPHEELLDSDLILVRALGEGQAAWVDAVSNVPKSRAEAPSFDRLILRLRTGDEKQLVALSTKRKRARPESKSAALREEVGGFLDKPASLRLRVNRFGFEFLAAAGTKFKPGSSKTEQAVAAATLALVGRKQYRADLASALSQARDLRGFGGLEGTAASDDVLDRFTVDAESAYQIVRWLRDEQKLSVTLDDASLTRLEQARAVAYAWREVDESTLSDTVSEPLGRTSMRYNVHRWLWVDQMMFTHIAWHQEPLVVQLHAALRGVEATENRPLGAFSELERTVTALWEVFNRAADPIEEVRKDASLTEHLAYRLLWRLPKLEQGQKGGAPAPEETAPQRNVVTRFLELNLARFPDLATAATNPKATSKRKELLDRLHEDLAILGQFISAKEGDDPLSAQIAKANAPPFPCRLKTVPELAPPLYAMPANSEIDCDMSVVWDHWTSAFGARYHWELLKLEAQQWEPVAGTAGYTVLGRRLERQMSYTWTDYLRLRDEVVGKLGPVGMGAESIAAALGILRALGTLLKSFFEAVGRKPDEKTISLDGPGVYMIRCSAGQSSDKGPLVRVPSVAYEIVIVYPADELSARYATMQLDYLNGLVRQNADLEQLLASGTLNESEQAEAREILAQNAVELSGDIGKILASQRDALKKQLEGLAGSAARQDLSVEPTTARKELEKRIDELNIILDQREKHVKGLEGKRLFRVLGVLVTDERGGTVRLVLEAAELEQSASQVTVLLIDSSARRSVSMKGAGRVRLDAVRDALKKILENSDLGYGRGYCTIIVAQDTGAPERLTFRVNADPESIVIEMIEGSTTLISLLALLAAPFTAGASLAILLPVGILGMIPSAYRLATRAQHGILRWDLQTALELVDVIGGFAGVGRAATGTLRMVRLSKGFMIVGHGTDGLGVVLGNVQFLEQVDLIRADASMSPAQRRAALMSLVGNKLMQDGITVGHSLASRARADFDTLGLEADKLPLDARPLPDSAPPPAPKAQRKLDPKAKLEAVDPALTTQARQIAGRDIAVLRDPSLAGESAEVRYRLDRLGFVSEVVIVLGKTAGKVQIPSHGVAAKELLKFTGVIGKARTLLEWARALVTGKRDRSPGKRAHEIKLELEKLPRQLTDYMDAVPERLAKGEITPEQVDAYVKGIRDQLTKYEAELHSAERGRGVVAAYDPKSPRAAEMAEASERVNRLLGVADFRVAIRDARTSQVHISVRPLPDGFDITVPADATPANVVQAAEAHRELMISRATRSREGTWNAEFEARYRGFLDAEPGYGWELRGDVLEYNRVAPPPVPDDELQGRRYDEHWGTFCRGKFPAPEELNRYQEIARIAKPDKVGGAKPWPPGSTRPPGHAYGKHKASLSAQRDLIRNPKAVFTGINENGRPVSIFWRDGDVTITAADDPTAVITTYGKSFKTKKKGGTEVDGTYENVSRWANENEWKEGERWWRVR